MTNIQQKISSKSGAYTLLALFFACACWLTASAQTINEAGKIVLSVGETRMAGKTVKVDDIVPVGAELSTGSDGYLYLKTIDNGFLIMRPGSIATVEMYEVNHENPEQSRFKFFLRQGIARSVSGDAVGKARKNFRFNTPVAAIGVRGTDFSVYADSQETRVIVSSGGVIVAGFGALCSPQGIGPCEGANSMELFAGTANVLLVRKGQNEPQISQEKELSPDLTAPPRLDEPQESATRKPRSATPNEAKIAHQDTSNLEPIKKPVVWGRWQAISDGLPATVDTTAVNNKEYMQITLGNYIMFREKSSAFPTPASGSMNFTLQDSLAHVSNPTNGASAEASLSSGFLNFNFAKAAFTTKVDLNALGETHVLYARGKVTPDGFFSNTSTTADGNMLVRGFLFKDTQLADSPGSANYLFRSTLNNGWEANGVANWSKK
ncbi:MAG: FecR family protein [Betaproteobacteria bacterium]|nr:FecR family protein [Betaproteobacteria bacterium]